MTELKLDVPEIPDFIKLSTRLVPDPAHPDRMKLVVEGIRIRSFHVGAEIDGTVEILTPAVAKFRVSGRSTTTATVQARFAFAPKDTTELSLQVKRAPATLSVRFALSCAHSTTSGATPERYSMSRPIDLNFSLP